MAMYIEDLTKAVTIYMPYYSYKVNTLINLNLIQKKKNPL